MRQPQAPAAAARVRSRPAQTRGDQHRILQTPAAAAPFPFRTCILGILDTLPRALRLLP
jgi:hypothetical protein